MNVRFLPLLFLLAACSPASENNEAQSTTMQPDAAITAADASQNPPIVTPACSLTLGFDAWEPYQYTDVGGRVAGLDIELISGVVRSIGCEVTYQQGTWVDLLAGLRQGEIDILLGASKTEARAKFAYFSDAYRVEEFSLYIRNDDAIHAEYASLSEFVANGSRIGIVADYLYGDEVAALLDDPSTSQFFTNAIMGELNVARLLDEDIAGFLEDSFVGASMLRRKALSELIVPHGIKIQTGDAFVMFSRQSITQEQLDLFNKELQIVKQSAEYQALLTKYSY